MKRSKTEQRFLAVLRSPTALLPDGSCPVCRSLFKGAGGCAHGWPDVVKANEEFILDMTLRRGAR